MRLSPNTWAHRKMEIEMSSAAPQSGSTILDYIEDHEFTDLWVTSCANFLQDQEDRFEYSGDENLLGDEFKDGTLYWFATVADQLLYLAYLRRKGFLAVRLWDLNRAEANEPAHVILSNQNSPA